MITDILQPTHLLFLLVVALLVLGPKRLPEAGNAIGKGLRGFRDAMSGIEAEASSLLHEPDTKINEPEPSTETVVASSADVQEPTVVASTSREADTTE